ncbi:MAG: hypothetical protein M3529_09975 [Actinomycetota bacterium]|nr:hypothetical protein [Actinomycetota bacterium]
MWITAVDEAGDQRVRARYDTHSERIDLGDDLLMHADTRVTVRGWSHDVDLRIGLDSGRLIAHELQVSRKDGGERVTSEVLRSVPVAKLVRAAAACVQHVRARHDGGGMTVGPAWPSEDELVYVERHRMDDDTLRIVARIYRVAYLLGDPPTRKVEKLLDVPRSTAGRWVAAARERGYLSEAPGPGKAGA